MANKSFTPNYWSLEDAFKSIYYVPVYQRPYSWEEEQVKVLLDDMFKAYKEDKNSSYYVGNIIIYARPKKEKGIINTFDIIDGQQRMASFSLIMLALFSCAIQNKVPSVDPTVQLLRRALWKYVDRQPVKELRTINLNSIEKQAFEDLYNYIYDFESNDFDVVYYCKTHNKTNSFEERVFKNFEYIYTYISEILKKASIDEILDFTDYILQNIHFIAIEAECDEKRVFSIFESINSKGKKLDQIDLIKTYIFSRLDSKEYDKYLKIWGDLIIETSDELYDYLQVFIKAHINFYRQNITINTFETLCENRLQEYYKQPDISSSLKMFLNDLRGKVKYYKMLSDTEEAYQLINKSKFRFYYRIFTDLNYQHPKPLFFRLLVDCDSEKLSKEDASDVVIEITKFMIKFLSISNRDSKDAITMFSNILNRTYRNNGISKEDVLNSINLQLIDSGLMEKNWLEDIQPADAYEKNRKLTVAMLSLYESAYDNDGKLNTSYDQAYLILKDFSTALSLDHLLVRTPDQTEDKYRYYKSSDGRLVLKDGNDFPKELVDNDMDYELFTQRILNRVGNLRIWYKDKNSARGNLILKDKDYSNFTTFNDITNRGKEIVEFLSEDFLQTTKVNVSDLKKKTAKKVENSYPKMEELIENNLINVGDEVYINLSNIEPEESTAILIDANHVIYKEKVMTINEWGCKVTGWKAIRIYAYMARVGEKETLQEKREKLIK